MASRLAVSHFSKAFSEVERFQSEKEVVDWLNEQIEAVNSRIFNYGKKHIQLKGMGTTFCAAMLTSFGIFIINIGDSRCYAWNTQIGFRQMTLDHTLMNDMIAHGELTLEEAKNFTKRNVLTNALGVWESVRADIDIHHEHLDGILLCSDGLHGYVKEEVIAKVIRDQELDGSLRLRKLLKDALEAGGYDNITMVVIDLEGDSLHG